MLEDNNYVHCLLIYFTKAFDSVDHLTLIVILKNIKIADNIIQWVSAFLTDRNQFVKLGEMWSFTRTINRFVVPGSGIEHTLFIYITDRKPIGSTNYITKYAADSSLFVSENYDVVLSVELRNVLKWVEHNKMLVNMTKAKVFYRSSTRNVLFPTEFPGIERVLIYVILLSVWLQEDMDMRKHADYMLHICNYRT